MLTLDSTLGELVRQRPGAARVLHRYGLDYCCGGHLPLGQACTEKGLDPETLLSEVETQAPPDKPATDWTAAPLTDLIEHIVARYHEPLRGELPRLVELARIVEETHADKAECPWGLFELLREVGASVESHLLKEEKILFPIIRAGRGPVARAPVRAMILEHEDHGKNLTRIRRITHDLAPPPSACASWKELYRALGGLEVELMDHIHLENNILFPRALKG